MAGMSTYLENQLLNWIKGTAFATAPTGLYVALYSNDPTDDNTGTEVTTTVRTAGRPAVTFGAISAKQIASNSIANFGNSAGAVTVTHYAIFDAASAGNMLVSNPLSGGSQAIAAGTAVSFASGAITVTAS